MTDPTSIVKCRPGLHDAVCAPAVNGCGCGCGPDGECTTQRSWRQMMTRLEDGNS